MTTQQTNANSIPAGICWFEIPAENVQRAKSFYSQLFGWKIELLPGAEAMEYHHIDTAGPDASPDGGLLKRQNPGHKGIINYISVRSVNESAEKAAKLGGTVCMPKTPVRGMGYFAICQDPEGNTFGLWELDANAK